MNPAIETRNLTKKYGKVEAVHQLSLQVEEGQIYALLGLNGAGKTTAMRMLLGMTRPTSGHAVVLQTRVRLGSREPWGAVGYMLATPHSYAELSVYENLEVARRLHPGIPRQAINQVIERVGLAEFASQKAGNLPRRIAQQLGLVKALLHTPRLLILDEPFNGLDSAGVVEIRELLLELAQRQGVTIFLSSRILTGIARFAQCIGIIQRGRLVQELSAAELEQNRHRRLLIRTRNSQAAHETLVAGGQPARILEDGTIEIKSKFSIEHPDDINRFLTNTGTPPTYLAVEEEKLEQYFLRLLEMEEEA